MASFLLHLAGADELARADGLPQPFARAIAGQPGALRLGTSLCDLPYFERFAETVLKHLLGRLTIGAEWGVIFHCRKTGTFGLALIEALRRTHGLGDEDQDQRLALVAGYLCHLAFDTVIHPIVQAEVARDKAAGSERTTDELHLDCERWQSLYFLEEVTGRDVAGTPYPRNLVRSFPGAKGLSPAWPKRLVSLVEEACLETHARAPGADRWDEWMTGARNYGVLLATPFGRREGLRGGDPKTRERFYERDGFRFKDSVAQAVALSLRYLEAGAEVLVAERISGNVRERFRERVPDLDIGMGA